MGLDAEPSWVSFSALFVLVQIRHMGCTKDFEVGFTGWDKMASSYAFMFLFGSATLSSPWVFCLSICEPSLKLIFKSSFIWVMGQSLG